MGGMPYLFEKGRLGTLSDDRYTRASPARRIKWLNLLQSATGNLLNADGTRSPLVSDIQTWSLPLPGSPAAANHVRHLNVDWFGLQPAAAAGVWQRVPGRADAPTGWWSSWTGDAHEIFRVALVAALEASLGFAHRDRPASYALSDVRRCWPIEMFWTCPSPKLELTVTWRDHQPWWSAFSPAARGNPLFEGGGQVTMVLSTPGWNNQSLLSRFLDRGTLIHTTAPEFRKHVANAPLTTEHARGLWVVGSNVEVRRGRGFAFTAPGDGLDPSSGRVVSISEVMLVRPAEVDGGVLGAGRTHPLP